MYDLMVATPPEPVVQSSTTSTREGRDMSAQQRRLTRIPRAIGLIAGAASLALIAACSGGGGGGGETDSRYGFPTVEQDAEAPITIWVDADRAKIAEAF